jgi:hypothetical protein
MTRQQFMLKLNREVTEEEAESLYEAGCSDASVETGPLGTFLDFSRDAPSLAVALVSAVRDIDKVPDLRAVGVSCENMVTLLAIAERAGVSREAIRLWATGQRGSGGFPPPMLITPGGEQLWDWEQVADWLRRNKSNSCSAHRWIAPDVRIRTLAIAQHVLAAREALFSEPDDTVREEFERLLQDA